MKRIIFLKSRMHKQGGLEKYLDRLARCFQQKGGDVLVLTSSKTNDFSHPYKVESLCKPSSISWVHILRFDRMVRKALFQKKVDILFGFDRHFVPLTHYRAGNGCHREYMEKRSQRYGLLRRGLLWLNPLHWVTLLSEKKTLECPLTTIICNSNMVKKEFLRLYPKANPSHIRVIHNGVEWSEYEEAFQQRNSQPHIPHILFVGNEWERKGVRVLLKALSNSTIPFRCTIIGKEKDWKSFDVLLDELHLRDKVELRPFHEKVLPWYQQADIFVLPSLYDPFANVTVEALAMGLWVITSSTNGGSEVIQEGKTGAVLSSFDTEPWTKAIEQALLTVQKEPLLKEYIRSEAKVFDFSRSLKTYVDLLWGER